jgi:excisionase family DNA binding protein
MKPSVTLASLLNDPSVIDAITEPGQWISTEDLAIRWKVSKTTIRRLRQSGKLPAVKIARGLYRFRLVDILAFESNGRILNGQAGYNKDGLPRDG